MGRCFGRGGVGERSFRRRSLWRHPYNNSSASIPKRRIRKVSRSISFFVFRSGTAFSLKRFFLFLRRRRGGVTMSSYGGGGVSSSSSSHSSVTNAGCESGALAWSFADWGGDDKASVGIKSGGEVGAERLNETSVEIKVRSFRKAVGSSQLRIVLLMSSSDD